MDILCLAEAADREANIADIHANVDALKAVRREEPARKTTITDDEIPF
jgi:hypothetical protein